MAAKTITMIKLKQIIRLRSNEVPLQAISRAVGVSRNTVKKYLQLIQVRSYSFDELLKMDDEQLEHLLNDPEKKSDKRQEELYACFPTIEKELARTGVTRWILWGDYRKAHPDGYSYSQFCDHYRNWRSTQTASMHLTHEPGDKMFLDFAGKKLYLTDRKTGEITSVEVFVSVLGHSQYTYVEAIPTQQKEDFIPAVENALHFYGGTPRVVVPDNLKSAVTKADKHEPRLNADFMDFANHYQTSILPTRSYKPQDKSLVEKAVNIIYSSIYAPLRDQVFYDLASLNKDISRLLEDHNQRHFQRKPISRQQLFEQEEKHCLQALPTQRYEMKQYKMATVMKTAHIHLREDKHYYSVPYRYIGKKVKLVYTRSYIAIYCNKERIAYPPRSFKHFGYTTQREHMPSTHQFVSDWNPEKFLSWSSAIDPAVRKYIQKVLDHYTYPEQAYRSCVGILSFEKKVGRRRLINAVKRATEYQTFNYSVIDRILRNGFDRLEDEKVASSPVTDHENIRGPENYS